MALGPWDVPFKLSHSGLKTLKTLEADVDYFLSTHKTAKGSYKIFIGDDYGAAYPENVLSEIKRIYKKAGWRAVVIETNEYRDKFYLVLSE